MRTRVLVLALSLSALLLAPAASFAADARVSLYGIRQDPSDVDASDYGRPGWGGGIALKLPLPATERLLAFVGGLEAVNLLSTTKEFRDGLTGLRVEQTTSQNYGRVFLGGEMGPHGNGVLQPYAGADLALVIYNIGTTVSIPDDFDRENSINQRLRDETEVAFGWSAGAGLVLDFGSWGLDGGVRFLKQYGVPQQLGDGAVTIQPSYVQYRLGVSLDIPRL